MGDNGVDDAVQRAGAGQHDLPPAQLVLRPGHQLARAATLKGTLAQPFAQVGLCHLVEPAQAQVAANALRLDPLCRLAPGTVEEQHRREPELARQVVDDLDRGLPVIVEEAAMQGHDAELEGETAALVGTAALGDHGQVRGRQAPVPRQVVLARIKWQHPSPGLRRSQRVIRRH